MKEREKILSGKKKKTSPAARTVYVSLDRADAIIDGCRVSLLSNRPCGFQGAGVASAKATRTKKL